MDKETNEAANFALFRSAHPNFAGRPVVSIQRGGDPPDFLCLDARGYRVGVELVEWINEDQTGPSKHLFKLERSYLDVIRSVDVQPPKNVGLIFMHAKDKVRLAPRDAEAFRNELYQFIHEIDEAWVVHPEWADPQGFDFTEFVGYPSLTQHLEGLCFYSRERFDFAFGLEWITFRGHGGAYTPEWMRDALLGSIRNKSAKYAKPHNKLKLQQQKLDEFYLLAYYDEAVLYNTPYDAPDFGFKEIGDLVAEELLRIPHPFDKVFLFSPLEAGQKVLQVWPA